MAISNNNTGIRTGVCTSTTRPTAPYEGQHIYETDTDIEYVWNGSAWVVNYVSAASPAFTGTPTAPTATAGTNTTQLATTEFVTTAAANVTSGFRNKIINGDFGINQRGFASTVNPANVYCFDRWNMYSNNGTSTYSPQTFTPGNTIAGQEPSQYLRVVSSGQTTANAATLVAQKIEDVRTCAGQPTTISFWAKCGTAGKKIAVEIAQDFGTGGSPSSTVVTHVNQVTLTTSWVRYTLNIVTPSISGKTLGTTANTSSLVLGFWFSAGTDFSTRTNSLGIQSDTFEIWGVQLEQNYQPTPFEQRPIGLELALCQRYYEKSYDIAVSPGTSTSAGIIYIYGGSDGSGACGVNIKFAVSKRSAGYTVKIWNLGGSSTTSWNWGTSSASGTSAVSAAFPTTNQVTVYVIHGYAWTATYVYGHYAIENEL